MALCVREPLRQQISALFARPGRIEFFMRPRKAPQSRWSNIDCLLNGEGDITIGRVGRIRCAATAADGHNALAMLVRRPRESLDDLLTRLDEAIRAAVEDDTFTDEING